MTIACVVLGACSHCETSEAMKTIRVGSGAGYSADRIEPAVEFAEKGGLDYLVFECSAERTIALAQQVRMKDANAGYDPLLVARMRAVLPICRGTRFTGDDVFAYLHGHDVALDNGKTIA